MQHVWRDMRSIPFNPIALDYRAYDLFISLSSSFTHCVILYTYTAERRDVLGCTRKYIPVGRVERTVLKSILPCQCQIHDQYGADGSFDEIDNIG